MDSEKNKLHRAQWADGNLEFNVQDRGEIPSTSSDLVIGARDQDGIIAHAAFEVGEILIFDKSLTDEEVWKLQGYLGEKWGLLGNFEAHPYKFSVPKFENRPEITLDDSYSFKKGSNVGLLITTTRNANTFTGVNLPPGLDLNSSTGFIYGFLQKPVPLLQLLRLPVQVVHLPRISILLSQISQTGNIPPKLIFPVLHQVPRLLISRSIWSLTHQYLALAMISLLLHLDMISDF